jgi:hypothetical protein
MQPQHSLGAKLTGHVLESIFSPDLWYVLDPVNVVVLRPGRAAIARHTRLIMPPARSHRNNKTNTVYVRADADKSDNWPPSHPDRLLTAPIEKPRNVAETCLLEILAGTTVIPHSLL